MNPGKTKGPRARRGTSAMMMSIAMVDTKHVRVPVDGIPVASCVVNGTVGLYLQYSTVQYSTVRYIILLLLLVLLLVLLCSSSALLMQRPFCNRLLALALALPCPSLPIHSLTRPSRQRHLGPCSTFETPRSPESPSRRSFAWNSST